MDHSIDPQYLFALMRRNCSALLSAIQQQHAQNSLTSGRNPFNSRSTSASSGNNFQPTSRSPSDRQNQPASPSSLIPSLYQLINHPIAATTASSPTSMSPYSSSSDTSLEQSGPSASSSISWSSEERTLEQLQEQIQQTLNAGGVVDDVLGDPNFEPLAHHHQEHIIQSHSESARNALIYVAVILAIYLVAVAFIAVQYYHKHSTLDPLTSFILRRSSRGKGGKRKGKDSRGRNGKHGVRRKYSNSGCNNGGFEAIRSVASTVSIYS